MLILGNFFTFKKMKMNEIFFRFATFIDEKESLSTPCGSLGYFAPEIASFASYKKGVDIWSLGIILYTL